MHRGVTDWDCQYIYSAYPESRMGFQVDCGIVSFYCFYVSAHVSDWSHILAEVRPSQVYYVLTTMAEEVRTLLVFGWPVP
jgi:hypothetical protein